ncbi:phosphoesterase family-domain-containing protein [Mariannaea sp. PMI_226]|nr:phosphoesterase family-domain-containing protein [Mariannaea sp. PMI_226]
MRASFINFIPGILALVVSGGALAVREATSRPPSQTIDNIHLTLPRAVEQPLIPGKAFNRIFQIWLENTDFETAAADENMQWLAEQGILLSNYYAVSHPSEPNYIAAVGGDTFGLQNDGDHQVPANISTLIDLLDAKQISWAQYEEDLPSDELQMPDASSYLRKHNPMVIYDSISNNSTRVSQIKNFSGFEQDLANKTLPQWAFFIPNDINDGHDTGLAFAGRWLRGFLEPLLKTDEFVNETLIIVTFDETKNYNVPNKVYTVLLGGAVRASLHNTMDNMYYNHYSALSTVSVNWDLPSLGRWDCDANVFSFVADKVGYKNTNISYDGLYWNASYPGPLNSDAEIPGWWPKPNTEAKCATNRGILESIKLTWGTTNGSFNYTNVYPYEESYGPAKGGTLAAGTNDANSTYLPPGTVPNSTSGTEHSRRQLEHPSRSLLLLLVGITVTVLSEFV